MSVDNTSSFLGRINPNRIVCAEPSPDVAQVVSSAFKASISAAKESEGSNAGALGFAVAASAAQLGERLATIQLLRDELSSLCRSYANGAVSSTTYMLRLSRLDRKMVTLLMSEMAAAAFGRNLAVLGGAASAGGNGAKTAALLAAEEKIKAASQKVAAERNAFEKTKARKTGEDNELTAARERLLDAYQELAVETSKLQAIKMTLAGASAVSSPSGVPGAIEHAERSSLTDISLVSLQQQFLDDNDIGTLIDACVSATNLVTLPRNEDGQIDTEKLMEFQNAAIEAARHQKEIDQEEGNKKGNATGRRITKNLVTVLAVLNSFISPLGQYCVSTGLSGIFTLILNQNQHQINKLRAQQGLAEAQTERAHATAKEACAQALAKDDASNEIKKFCGDMQKVD